jgi:protein-L-isoaspartate(D-aspartate) O-methyltransferase
VSGDDPRQRLREQLRRRIRDGRVVAAVLDAPRELYVDPAWRSHAWDDRALPIADGQTISQPTMVAIMTEELEPRPGDTVLDVGTGSGYQAAVLARLVDRVFSIEIRRGLARRARERLARDPRARDRVHIVAVDARRGFPGRLAFDGIVVAAATARIPEALLEQLGPGGRLLAPVGPPGIQELVRVRRRPDGSLVHEELGGCAFVPLVSGRL